MESLSKQQCEAEDKTYTAIFILYRQTNWGHTWGYIEFHVKPLDKSMHLQLSKLCLMCRQLSENLNLSQLKTLPTDTGAAKV